MLQAAESGNVEDFGRLYSAEPARLGVRDSRGRAAAHQAAARNKLNILQFIAAHGGGMTDIPCVSTAKYRTIQKSA
jgi:transient receptor potential cation channel subfamily A protein 1